MLKKLLEENAKSINAYIESIYLTLEDEEFNSLMTMLSQDSRKSIQQLAEKFQKKRKAYFDEVKRVQKLWFYENKLYSKGFSLIAGTDEVGRGPIAGPVVAASVILPKNCILLGINDSKKLSLKKRLLLDEEIRKHAIDFKIIEIDSSYIDKINILKASGIAMAKAIADLMNKPDMILIDGNQNIPIEIPQQTLIGGDSKSINIAAASIIAKVYRDKLMDKYDEIYHGYNFSSNKGYGTKDHYEAIKKYGLTPIHRRSFSLEQYEE